MIKALILALFFASHAFANCIPSSIDGKGKMTPKPTDTTNAPYGFMEYLPPSFGKTKKLWPLIIMLHGVGERGDGKSDLSKLLKNGPLQRVLNGREFPAIIITPQTSARWNSERLLDLINYSFKNYPVDRKRIYMTGLSMGGGGTWDFIRNVPDVLAAAIPICGAATASFSFEEGKALSSLPIYAVHNADDEIVDLSRTVEFARSFGQHQWSRNDFMDGYVKENNMTAYFNPGTREWNWVKQSRAVRHGKNFTVAIDHSGGHDSWTKTYESKVIWEWLFCQSR